MQNRKLIILIILGIAAIFSDATPVIAEKDIARERRAKRSSFTSWGRNPFSLYRGPATTISGLALSGVLWDENAPTAIVNEEIVGIGDKIGIYTVVDIQKDKVILTDGTKNYELNLSY